jgi:hypothetical protein
MLVTSSWKIFLLRERGLSTVIAAIGTALTSRLEGNENGNWLGVRDDFRNWLIRAA